ncbi:MULTISPECIES: hypothetical protein [Ruminococcus]|uniref:Secreted protein n=1 Tax=Ruminococcus bicirculans (ex Wegman et al. 2014) TaxID=1160721 RepID=A0AAW6E6L4_9FIRM|nr:hypothetical protein [Ruminococcus bicirculans (ex Wegman et al. 2014)]MDB8736949.1 hypothetical protein [Ruminococcus bicirculans (ex Wegman et al. 2014)]MDB8742845.1 hypothetical protein [Ruminococcus bicirculans (ex Wegman et al. 2014)]
MATALWVRVAVAKWSRYQAGTLSTCKSKAAVWGYGFQTLPERPPLRAGVGNVKFKKCHYFVSEARRLWCKL